MRVIVAGSRECTDRETVASALWSAPSRWTNGAEIVSGAARGVDSVAFKLATDYDFDTKVFPADWDKHGKGAGFIRNQQMAEYADALIAV